MQSVNHFLAKLKSQKKPRVLVVGDCMLDEYYQVKVSRISPESPNITVMVSDDTHPEAVRPGGAGNVCCQFRPFGVRCDFLGFLDDEAFAYMAQAGIDCSNAVILPGGVPRKRRFFHGQTQVGNRWDVESLNYGLHPDILTDKQKELQAILGRIACDYDAIILSDYDKGVFSGTTVMHKLMDHPLTIVDPKKGPIGKWAGCKVIKPNAAEAANLTGQPYWHLQAKEMKAVTNCSAVVITHGELGVRICDDSGYHEHTPQSKVVANSVIGAGDSFAATLAVAMSLGMGVREASEVSYQTGAIYVQGRHNSPVTLAQLESQSKYVAPEELSRREGKLVFTNGCFDILHAGHVESLRFARSKGDRLVVAVNSDESVRKLKGPTRPVNSLDDRMKLLAALECVDYVVSFDDTTPLELIKKIRPDVVVKGGDYKPEEVVGFGIVPEVVIAPLVAEKSTTSLIQKVRG